MLINLPNRIGKIKNKQDTHVCAQDLCITKASNPLNILLIAKGLKAKFNIRSSPTLNLLLVEHFECGCVLRCSNQT